MSKVSLDSKLQNLKIDNDIITKLNKEGIFEVKDLWQYNRKKLKELGLTDPEIKHITIKLQLNSIDLNKKVYHKN